MLFGRLFSLDRFISPEKHYLPHTTKRSFYAPDIQTCTQTARPDSCNLNSLHPRVTAPFPAPSTDIFAAGCWAYPAVSLQSRQARPAAEPACAARQRRSGAPALWPFLPCPARFWPDKVPAGRPALTLAATLAATLAVLVLRLQLPARFPPAVPARSRPA